MTRRLAALAAAVLCMLAFASSALGAARTLAGIEREANIEVAVEGVVKKEKIPGAIVGVWQQGQPSFEVAFGVRNKKTKKPMTTGLHMRIGSETKTFTGTAVLQLVKEGKVGLDEPISRYVSGVPNGDNITVRELGEMRSGLLSYTANEEWALRYFGNPQMSWKPTELLPYSFGSPALFAPGTQFNYSNTNTILLGLLVENVSGEPLRTYVEKHLLKPLGMTDTHFPTGAEFPSPHADGYTKQTLDGKEAVATNWNPSWGWAAGAMTSDLHDLRIWAKSVATGSLLTPAVQKQRERFIPAEGLEPAKYGFALFDIAGWIGHNGSLPGYESLTVYEPKLKTTMVVLLNTDISPNAEEPSTLVGQAITKVITPKNVFYFNAGGQTSPKS
jgi:D-alanyl-D-alanine carboxypeptidase